MTAIRIALAQINPVVGDLDGNSARILASIESAKRSGADLVAFPELAVTGYPPEDLVLRSSFVEDNLRALQQLAGEISGISAVIGYLDRGGPYIFNAAALVIERRVAGVYHKHLLPNYGVFDEERYFEPGDGLLLAHLNNVMIGLTICEDIWSPDGPHIGCAAAGADIIVNINGSPYHRGKGGLRLDLLQRRARESGSAIAYVNMVGGQDELVFDGQSLAVDASGELIARASQFTEELLVFDISPSNLEKRKLAPANEAVKVVDLAGVERPRIPAEPSNTEPLEEFEEIYRALVVGVGDYFRKNGFNEALIGLSGGIDSSVTAAIAADALGPENVTGVLMPSRFTSNESLDLGKRVASNLGIRMEMLSIVDIHTSFLQALDPVLSDTEPTMAEENIQPRIRGTVLMAISNKRPRSILLSTGNKSEMATGYCTLYGDMAGGFAVLKDVPKTLVYQLAGFRNQHEEVIPQEVIKRPPTAELRPGQLDSDTLPPYEILDPILEAYVEEDKSITDIVGMGFDPEVVQNVAWMVDTAEYKRRQAPPGIKITDRAFGRDRRLPITNRYRNPL